MKKKIVRFMLWVNCIPKGKRKHSNVKIGTQEIKKDLFDNNKEVLTKSIIDDYTKTVTQETANKSIKEVKSAYVLVREVELDGNFETYMPFKDVRITITL